MSWADAEPRLASVAAHQVVRLVKRAWHRLFVVLGLTMSMTAAIFVLQARRPILYEAEVGLLIKEGAFAPDGRPRPLGELLASIHRVAFATPRLAEVVEKHGLVKRFGVASTAMAVDRVRKLTEVQTRQDYFTGYRQGTDRPRITRVTIESSAPAPELALAVARDLGELIAETQTERESEAATERVDSRRILAEAAGRRAQRLREDLERERESVMQPAEHAPSALLEMRAVADFAEQEAKTAAANLLDAQLQLRAIDGIGRSTQVVNTRVPSWRVLPRAERQARQFGLALAISVFLAVLAVGAWDPGIRDEQDLARAGLDCLGTVMVCRTAPPDVV